MLSEKNNTQPRGPFRKSPGQPAYKQGPKKILCYNCEGEHLIKDCVKLAKEMFQDKQKDAEVSRWYKNKLRDTMQRGRSLEKSCRIQGTQKCT